MSHIRMAPSFAVLRMVAKVDATSKLLLLTSGRARFNRWQVDRDAQLAPAPETTWTASFQFSLQSKI